MPQVKNISTSSNGVVGVWKIEEPTGYFAKYLPMYDYKIPEWNRMSASRRLEWLAGRFLAQQISENSEDVEITKNENGKPILKGNKNISISHSRKMVATAIGETETGVDIQYKSKRLYDLAFKFLSDQEFSQLSHDNLLEQLHIYWGVKEALYKIHGESDLFFKRDIYVESFALQKEGIVKAHITNRKYRGSYLLNYDWMDDYVLVYISKTLKN